MKLYGGLAIIAVLGGLQGYLWTLVLIPPISFVASLVGGIIVGLIGGYYLYKEQ